MKKVTVLRKKENILAEKIDRLGFLTAMIKTYQKEADEIKKWLTENFGEGTYDGNKNIAKITKTISYEYDREKIYKKLGREKYLECSKLLVTELKKYISEKELVEMVINTIETPKVSVKLKGEKNE
jgi:hypothetical protein